LSPAATVSTLSPKLLLGAVHTHTQPLSPLKIIKFLQQMASDTSDAYDGCPPAARVFALSELWALVAEHSGLVGAWRPADECVQSFESGGEGVAANSAGAGDVRRV
jgi:hypothetical protein